MDNAIPERASGPSFDDALSAYDEAWEQVHAAQAVLSCATEDLVASARRRALDEAGVDHVLDDLLLLDLLGRVPE